MNLTLAKEILPSADSNAGLQYLEYYAQHKVYHPGVDLNKGVGNEDLGLPLQGFCDAEVVYVSPKPGITNGQNGGLGLYVVLYHPTLKVWSRYMHLSSAAVVVGQMVRRGQVFAALGNSGTTWAHCHVDMWSSLEMQDIMKQNWRPYGFYPSNKSKAWVAERFLNPEVVIQRALDLINKPIYTPHSYAFFQVNGDPKIYVEGMDKKLHHIANAETFVALFGEFSYNPITKVSQIDPAKISFPITNKQ